MKTQHPNLIKRVQHPNLIKLIQFWVDKLRINEWRLEVKLGTPEELQDNAAQVKYCVTTKEAVILLSRLKGIDRELEEDLVHELLHLVFIQSTYELSDKARHLQQPFEFALDTTAVALVGLRRRNWK